MSSLGRSALLGSRARLPMVSVAPIPLRVALAWSLCSGELKGTTRMDAWACLARFGTLAAETNHPPPTSPANPHKWVHIKMSPWSGYGEEGQIYMPLFVVAGPRSLWVRCLLGGLGHPGSEQNWACWRDLFLFRTICPPAGCYTPWVPWTPVLWATLCGVCVRRVSAPPHHPLTLSPYMASPIVAHFGSRTRGSELSPVRLGGN